ncbi:MAG: ACP S-malonyltransferase [Kiritimatiellae bacterium]|nr:ACP S-malonyltransferase [Kiritimatiellia bacterium]
MSDKAAVFAGQGAQFAGMGKDLAADPTIASLYDRANAVLNFDLKKVCFEGPAEALTRSNYCQPAIFVTSVACWQAFGKRFPACAFKAAAGLSLGEWTALHVAGVLDFEATVRVLEARGRFMQQACEEQAGGMVSVMGLSREQVAEVCRQSGAHMANVNSDQQIVLSGTKAAVAEAEKLAAGQGAKTVMLNVAGAFHSPLMNSARERLSAFIKDVPFAAPKMTVISNVTGETHVADGETVKQTMLRQVTESVRWADCVRAAAVKHYVEFGPGKVLSGLIKRIDKQNATANVQDLASLEAAAGVAGA